jgi:uncharacterized Rmd1/YagE family protein
MDELIKHLINKTFEPKIFDEVIHIQKRYDEQERSADIFFFAYGCVIAWGLDEFEEKELLESLKPYEVKALNPIITDLSSFIYKEGEKTYIDQEEDVIILDNDEAEDTLIKLSFSHAYSQSVKLETFERTVTETIKNTRYLPEELSTKGKISLSRKKLSQKIGALFAERNSINLHSDILDTPEFFWYRSRYEPFYEMALENINLDARLDVLNRRLDVIHELYEILSNELNHIHSSRLEWIIIYLIACEIGLSIVEIVLHHWS